MFKNGNTWPSVITILLTINLVLMGFVIARLEKMDDKVDASLQASVKHEVKIQSIEENYAKQEWVRNNFREK